MCIRDSTICKCYTAIYLISSASLRIQNELYTNNKVMALWRLLYWKDGYEDWNLQTNIHGSDNRQKENQHGMEKHTQCVKVYKHQM